MAARLCWLVVSRPKWQKSYEQATSHRFVFRVLRMQQSSLEILCTTSLSRSPAKYVDVARAKIRALPRVSLIFLILLQSQRPSLIVLIPMSWSIKSNILLYRAKAKARTERLRYQGSKLVFVLTYSAHAKCPFFPLAWGRTNHVLQNPYFPWSLFELL